ncbi:MAG: hypothetical protein ABII01_03100 [Candidatus Woesearchaeota archaeon]
MIKQIPIQVDGLWTEYCTADLENADETKVILYSGGVYNLFDAQTLDFIRELRLRDEWYSGSSSDQDFSPEPRWHPTDPNIFYFINRKDRGGAGWNLYNLYQYNISKDDDGTVDTGHSITTFHNFADDWSEVTVAYSRTKGAPSMDGKYRAFLLKGISGIDTHQKVAMLDMQTNTVISMADFTGSDSLIKAVTTSPSGKYAIVRFYNTPEGTISGCSDDWGKYPDADFYYHDFILDAANPNMCWPTDVADQEFVSYAAHNDMAIDTEGYEGSLVFNDDIYFRRFDTNEWYKVVEVSDYGSMDLHISANNYDKPGWAVVSTYGSHPFHWMELQHFMVEIKPNGRIWRLAFHHSEGTDYSEQAFANINTAGTVIYWGGTWNDPGGQIESYRLNLPETWWEDLMDVSQNCSELGGTCCSAGQTCQGGNFNISLDCGSCCVEGICQTPQSYHDADLDHSGDINKTEIDSYVQRWKGDMSISLSEIIEAIRVWKQGSY